MPRTTRSSTRRKATAPPATTRRAPKRSKIQASGPPRDMPILPVEILYQIVSYVQGKDQLVNLMRTSSVMWDIAAPRLYADMRLNEAQVGKLLDGARDPKLKKKSMFSIVRMGRCKLTERAARAFAFIKTLTIPPLSGPMLEKLWDITMSLEPLFPNVTGLSIDDYLISGFREPDFPTKKLPRDVLLFDTPNVCMVGSLGWDMLQYYPANETRALTYHINGEVPPDYTTFPPSWESLRIFPDGPVDFWDDYDLDEISQFLVDKHKDGPSIQICFNLCAGSQCPRTDHCVSVPPYLIEETPPGFDETLNPDAKIHIIYDSTRPPCAVCGTRVREPPMTRGFLPYSLAPGFYPEDYSDGSYDSYMGYYSEDPIFEEDYPFDEDHPFFDDDFF